MTDAQKELLREIRDKFDPTENETDRLILKEVTDYRYEPEGEISDDFWA